MDAKKYRKSPSGFFKIKEIMFLDLFPARAGFSPAALAQASAHLALKSSFLLSEACPEPERTCPEPV
jgi:hypothetical protein